ncbi:MAG: hypothetical protein ABFD89_15250 [Bryobacteraceae bacterium]
MRTIDELRRDIDAGRKMFSGDVLDHIEALDSRLAALERPAPAIDPAVASVPEGDAARAARDAAKAAEGAPADMLNSGTIAPGYTRPESTFIGTVPGYTRADVVVHFDEARVNELEDKLATAEARVRDLEVARECEDLRAELAALKAAQPVPGALVEAAKRAVMVFRDMRRTIEKRDLAHRFQSSYPESEIVINALESAIAAAPEPEVGPVAYLYRDNDGDYRISHSSEITRNNAGNWYGANLLVNVDADLSTLNIARGDGPVEVRILRA